jgi:hypothetical protein
LANSNEEGKTYIGPSLEPCAPPVCAPMMGAHVCATPPTWRGPRPPLGARAYAPLGRARPPNAAPPCHAHSLAVRALFSVRASFAARAPVAMRAPHARPHGRARPSLPCTPHVRAFLTRPHPYCVRLPSISPTNLLFIPPLGHPGL